MHYLQYKLYFQRRLIALELEAGSSTKNEHLLLTPMSTTTYTLQTKELGQIESTYYYLRILRTLHDCSVNTQ